MAAKLRTGDRLDGTQMLRLYRPQAEIVSGRQAFPQARPIVEYKGVVELKFRLGHVPNSFALARELAWVAWRSHVQAGYGPW